MVNETELLHCDHCHEDSTGVRIRCRKCGEICLVAVKTKDLAVYESPNRPAIQNIFPYLSAADRELFITQICGICFDKMFGDSENVSDI